MFTVGSLRESFVLANYFLKHIKMPILSNDQVDNCVILLIKVSGPH